MLELLRLLFSTVRAGSTLYATDAQRQLGARFRERAAAVIRDTTPPERPASARLSEDQWQGLRGRVSEALAAGLSPAQVARELLSAIDTTVRQNLWHLFQAPRARLVLGPGDVFPIAAHDLRPFFNRKQPEQVSLVPRPGSQNMGLKQLTYLGVLPTLDEAYEVELHFDTGAALAEFCETPRVGVLLPNADLFREFAVDREPQREAFFGVRPLDEAAQRARVLELLAKAESAGVTLALLPELSVTPGLAEELRQWFLKPERTLPALVAGSFHATESQPDLPDALKVNRSHALAVGLPRPLRHDKFNPFVLKEWDGKALRPHLKEDLTERPRRITVHWTEDGWSFTTLICKDFLDQGALNILDALRVNFVFIVALSAETQSFCNDASRLLASGQTMTFVANFGVSPASGSKAAVAVLPLSGLAPATFPAAWLNPPEILVFDLFRALLGWRPT